MMRQPLRRVAVTTVVMTLASRAISLAQATTAGTAPAGSKTAQDRGRANAAQQPSSSTNQRKFVETMMIANMAEIQLGQMAQSQALSPDVKAFGEMVVADHTKAIGELRPLAQQLEVPEPRALDVQHAAVANRLSRLNGAAFDREFVKAMVSAHRDVAKQAKPMARPAASSSAASTGQTDANTNTS